MNDLVRPSMSLRTFWVFNLKSIVSIASSYSRNSDSKPCSKSGFLGAFLSSSITHALPSRNLTVMGGDIQES